MSRKMLYSLSDENPDLQRQIGCMNGIFQLFDRHHSLSGRRFANHHHKRLPPGQNDNHERKPHTASERPKKTVKEKKRISTESSRTSYSYSSSSCSSTLSSMDCNKQSQQEPSSYGQANFPRTPTRDSPIYQPSDSSQLTQQHVGIRDVVKDSMYREARELSIKTATKENAGGQTLKYMDSPRPAHLQQPKAVKSRVSSLNESFRVLPKLRETPLRKDCFAPKDAPRFSYDGRESRDAFKSTVKEKELPRLSLDSRERSMRRSSIEMKSNNLLGDLQRRSRNPDDSLNQQQESGSYRRLSSVVAKLMGLEEFPEPTLANEIQPGQMKTIPDVERDSFSRTTRATDEIKHNRISGSPRNSRKEPVSPRTRNADSVNKPIASSKFPVETAPWRQPDENKGQPPAARSRETPIKSPNPSLSVYGEIEKRLAQLEFKKSGKDLRALKQILEAMHKTKEVLESRKDQASIFAPQTCNNSIVDQGSKFDAKSGNPTTLKGATSPTCFKSPIVIMKAAKSIEKASNSVSSASLTENLSGLRRLCSGDSADIRKETVDKRTTKDPTPKTIHLREPSSRLLHPKNKNNSAENLRPVQTSKGPKPITGKNKTAKSSEFMNPRLQQQKLSLEKQSNPTTPSSVLSRTRRQVIESSSPHRKSGAKSVNLQQRANQLCDISTDERGSSHQDDATSLQSESNISTASHIESEVTSTERSDTVGDSFKKRGLKDPETWYTEDSSTVEPTKVGVEQPSPVSVLDATFYRDEPPSPVKKISYVFKDDEAPDSDEAEWRLMNLDHSSSSGKPSFTSDNDDRNIQNLMHVYPTHMNSVIDEIALINNSANPDHRYISEILLASGLLRDVESGLMSIQLHPSGYLINPNLFLVLEQNKASTMLLHDEHKDQRAIRSETIIKKAQRKLIFDAVNEALVHKLLSGGSSKLWVSPSSLVGKRPRQQQLLRDLCTELDCLQANNSNCSLDDQEDSLRSIIWEDLMHGTTDWTDCQGETSWLALDVERLIFKDLITEIVRDEMAGLRGQSGRHCRQLFSK